MELAWLDVGGMGTMQTLLAHLVLAGWDGEQLPCQ